MKIPRLIPFRMIMMRRMTPGNNILMPRSLNQSHLIFLIPCGSKLIEIGHHQIRNGLCRRKAHLAMHLAKHRAVEVAADLPPAYPVIPKQIRMIIRSKKGVGVQGQKVGVQGQKGAGDYKIVLKRYL